MAPARMPSLNAVMSPAIQANLLVKAPVKCAKINPPLSRIITISAPREIVPEDGSAELFILSLRVQELRPVEMLVEPASGKQLIVCADIDDSAVVQHYDPVG